MQFFNHRRIYIAILVIPYYFFASPEVLDATEPVTDYDAVGDWEPRALPPLPKIGPAGFVFIEPTFRTRVMRVTDENSVAANTPEYQDRSMLTPSSSEQN